MFNETKYLNLYIKVVVIINKERNDMKVFCFTNEYHVKTESNRIRHYMTSTVSTGEWYDVVDSYGEYYTIVLKNGYCVNIPIYYFMTVSQLREEKINKLGI